MANLNSPGVQVQVIDESFYTPAAPGTVPLIFVTSAQDKANSSATGTAQGTTKANAGKVWTITSQRDLTDTFGTPKFYVDQNQNPIHGGELNEYGLQAAYSLLAVSSKAYVVRADIDLSQLTASGSVPVGDPASGTYWVDTGNTVFGINEWDATNKVFVTKTPKIIDDSSPSTALDGMAPSASFGIKGDYAVVATSDNQNPIYYKNSDNNWVILGSNLESSFESVISGSSFVSHVWQTSFPVAVSTGISGFATNQTLSINGLAVTFNSTSTAAIATSINAATSNHGVAAKINSSGKLELYADISGTQNGAVAVAGTAVTKIGLTTGTYAAVTLTIAPHTQVPQYGTNSNPSGSAYIKTTSPSKGASWVVKYYNGSTKTWGTVSAPIYATSEAAIKGLDITGGKGIAVGQLYVESNYDHGTGSTSTSVKQANFKIYRRTAVNPTSVTGENDVSSLSITRDASNTSTEYSFTISETIAGSSVMSTPQTVVVGTVASSGTSVTATFSGQDIVAAISGAGLINVSAELTTTGRLVIKHALGGDIHITDTTTDNNNMILDAFGFSAYDVASKSGTANLYAAGDYDTYDYRASNWKPLVYEALQHSPDSAPADGQLWYDSNLEDVDIMYHNGDTWVGYLTAFPNSDPKGPQIKASAPTKQSDGTDLVDGDIWIDASDSEMYGKNIYIWNGILLKWVSQDPSDQETPTGWKFADARWSNAGIDDGTYLATIEELLSSDYLDPDAPDPAEYPQGMRLWNLRRSGFNVKKYVKGHIDINENDGKNTRYNNDPMDGSNLTTAYSADRWISVSPNNADGSGSFGRNAQRSFVVSALKSAIDVNSTIRDTDSVVFNLIACPGYPEAIQNMVALNADRAHTGFVIGDTPFRLKANGTDLGNWGSNIAGAVDNGDQGGVSNDEYMAMFYPSGYTNDNSGNYIVVPPSHMMLRTIATSDQKSYQWFAPSGIRRGGVDNATSVGYIENGEFKTTSLPTSLRDVMIQTARVNPIATLNGVGVVNFGNITRAKGTSSLDRINVSRLVAYLRRQLDLLARPFLFEPNDRNTRNEIKNAAESLLLELVGQRALYDYIVVCDESNNTSARIDRSELWMDIAVEPVKAVEFIYIPLRLKNTGDIKAGL
jgi:hypothetical protein